MFERAKIWAIRESQSMYRCLDPEEAVLYSALVEESTTRKNK